MFVKPAPLFALSLSALLLSACATGTPATLEAAPQTHQAPFTPQNLAQSCAGKDEWDAPSPPALLHGRTYYVGTCGISSLLIDSGDGLILLDGGVEAAGPMILANIEALGFDPKDIKFILTSHDHYDHVAALGTIQAASGAPIWAFAAAAPQLNAGTSHADDPQQGHLDDYPPLRAEARLTDGQPIRLGEVAITPIANPVHALGSASYHWQSCEDGACQTMAYMDSLSTPPQAFRFSDHPHHVSRIRQGFEKAGKISCDILITPHPSASSMMERFAGHIPFANPQSCAAYTQKAQQIFEQRLVKEQQ